MGERDLTEHDLDHLAGYGDSRPVRIANRAWRQRQLDVTGEVLQVAYVLRERLERDAPTAAFPQVVSHVGLIAAAWSIEQAVDASRS